MPCASQYRKTPASEGGDGGDPRFRHHRGDADFALYGTVGLLQFRPGVGPVAHQSCIAGLEGLEGFRFGVIGHRSGADTTADQAFHPGHGPLCCRRLQRRIASLIQPAAAKASDDFQCITTETFVLTPLPDEALFRCSVLNQLLTDCNQFIRCFRRRVHQVRPPVQKSDVGIERPAIELIGVAIALPGAADQGLFIVSVKEATQGLQPLGGGVLGKPGDIDQQGVVGGIAKQQAADGEV